MKTLTANALAEIAKRFGTEPLCIVEIEWNVGSVSQYADKDVLGIDGKILSVSPISNFLPVENEQGAEVSVTLDDTDGLIKTILDTTNVHKRNATVYQYYGGLVDADKFTVFKGKISTPFSWGENDRQIELTVTTEIENYEVGFSPEEGQLSFVSEDFVGQPWPLGFGRVVHVPAKKVKQLGQAKLLDLLCKHDPILEWKLEQIEDAYQVEQFMFRFWKLVQIGANNIAPDVEWILTEYIKAIIEEDIILTQIVVIQLQIKHLTLVVQQFPRSILPRLFLRASRDELQQLARLSHIKALNKEYLEDLCERARFEYDIKKKALSEQIKHHNRMRELYGQYVDIEKELCEQKRCELSTVRVQEAEKAGFPDVTPVDAIIKQVRFRVQFNHANNTMDILACPIDRYQDLRVQDWTVDDEPCSSIPTLDGMDMFRLELTNPPNLEGMYLLLKKAGTDDEDGCRDRHIVKVRKHKGQKVYYTLVEWDRQGVGENRGYDLDAILRGLEEDLELVPGPLGTAVPAGLFTGAFNKDKWLLTQSQRLLDILQYIGQPLNREEFRNLAKLVFLADKDKISDQLIIVNPTVRDIYTIVGPDVAEVVAASGSVPRQWLDDYCIPYEEIPKTLFFEAEAGTSIFPKGPDCEIYIANILPSTIHAVHAYRTNDDNERFLAPVPSRYYVKNESANLTGYTVTALTFPRSLKNIPGERWENEVYVTYTSSEGPNVVDILDWLATTYTDKTPNAASFAAVKADLQSGGQDLYPCDFVLFDRPNVLTEMNRIAWESRLSLLVSGDEFFLKYLSKEPSVDDTIDESDIETKTLQIEYTSTENLATRIIATYNKSYLPLEPGERQPKHVLRHNVKQYGLHSVTEHFHTFTNSNLVLKSATFWMIRRSNTWKRVRFRTFHTKIRFDTFDTVDLQLANKFVSNANVKGVIVEAVYDPSQNAIDLVIDPGIKVGEMDQYIHFWPALEDPTLVFPTAAEISLGYAGGFGPGQNVTGTIDDCPPEPA